VQQIAQTIYPESLPEPEEQPIKRGRKKIAPPPRPSVTPEWAPCHEKYREDTYQFIMKKIVKAMVDQRIARGLYPADNPEEAEEYQSMLDPSDRTTIEGYC